MNQRLFIGGAAVLFFYLAAWNLAAGRSEVADAAMKGDKAAVWALLQKKADVNAPQVDGLYCGNL